MIPKMLHDKEELEDVPFLESTTSKSRKKVSFYLPESSKRLILFQWAVIGFLAVLSTTLLTRPLWEEKRICMPVDHVYSPADHLIKYKLVTFTGGFGPDNTIYQGGYKPEVNQAWDDLYGFGISSVPMADAAKLTNKTVPIPDDPGHYVVSLDVFHQLHCLNQIRKHAWSIHMDVPEENIMTEIHLDHCIDSIRQSVMCSSDLAPIVWLWIEENHLAQPVAQVAHTCRDFDVIREWAEDHHIGEFNRSIYVPDPLKGG